MKIYYTTDGSIDENLEQVCPHGEKHIFEREDGSTFTMNKMVGSGGCESCPFCYGAGFGYAPYGVVKFKYWMLIPCVPNVDQSRDGYGFPIRKSEEEKAALGMKQFVCTADFHYVKCAKCFTDEKRNSFKIRFKIWMWHHITRNVYDIIYHLMGKWYEYKYNLKYGK